MYLGVYLLDNVPGIVLVWVVMKRNHRSLLVDCGEDGTILYLQEGSRRFLL